MEDIHGSKSFRRDLSIVVCDKAMHRNAASPNNVNVDGNIQSMKNFTSTNVQEALRPLASLISKTEKAQQKLAPGTWQFLMLQDNLTALRIGSTYINELLRTTPSGEG